MPSSQPSFGMLPGNNAPMPIPGTTNPTGTNSGVGFGASFPNYPIFGSPNQYGPTPSANAPLSGGSGMGGLSTGMFNQLNNKPGNPGDHLYKQLVNAYGSGMGPLLFNELITGFYNPQTANAFINSMQPAENRGRANIMQSFGAEGSRFGSAAALGLGDYNSQVNLNEQQTLANMYMSAQQQQLQLLEGVLPTLHGEQANKGGFWHDLLGGLEIAGGVASMFVPGMQGLGGMLIGGGVGTLAGGLDQSGGTSGGGGMTPSFGLPGFGGNTGTFGANAPSVDSNALNIDQWMAATGSQSAAATLGGAAPTGTAFGMP